MNRFEIAVQKKKTTLNFKGIAKYTTIISPSMRVKHRLSSYLLCKQKTL